MSSDYLLNQEEQNTLDRARAMMQVNTDMQAQQAGQTYDLMAKYGVGPNAVNTGSIVPVLNLEEIYKDAPKTVRFLAQDVYASAIAKNDIRELAKLEILANADFARPTREDKDWGFFEGMIQAARFGKQEIVDKGTSVTEFNIYGNQEGDAPLVGRAPIMPPTASNVFEDLAFTMAEQVPQIGHTLGYFLDGLAEKVAIGTGLGTAYGYVAGNATGVGLALPEEVVTVPTGFVAGGLAAVKTAHFQASAKSSFEIEAGLAYQEMKENAAANGEAFDHTMAREIAMVVGTMNAGLELVSASLVQKYGGALLGIQPKRLSKVISQAMRDNTVGPAVRKVLTGFGRDITEEGLTEAAQELTVILGDYYRRANTKEADADFVRDVLTADNWDRLLEAGKKGAIGAFGWGAVPVTVSAYRAYSDAATNQQMVQKYTALKDILDNTDLKKYSTEKTRELMQDMGISGTVDFDPEVITAIVTERPEIASALGINNADVVDNEASGRSVRVPLGKMLTELDAEQFDTLIKAGRAQGTEMSSSVAQAIIDQGNFTEVAEQYIEATRSEVDYQRNIRRIRSEVLDAGRTQAEADGAVKILSSFVNRMAVEGVERNTLLNKIRITKGGEVDYSQVNNRKLFTQPGLVGDEYRFQSKAQIVQPAALNVKAEAPVNMAGATMAQSGVNSSLSPSQATGQVQGPVESQSLGSVVFGATELASQGNEVNVVSAITEEFGGMRPEGLPESQGPAIVVRVTPDNMAGLIEALAKLGVNDVLDAGEGHLVFTHDANSLTLEQFNAAITEVLSGAEGILGADSIYVNNQKITEANYENYQKALTGQPETGAGVSQAVNRGGSYKTLYQEGPEARGSVTIGSEQYIVTLLQNADASTLFHELGHIFLAEMQSMVNSGVANPAILEQWEAIKNKYGIESDTSEVGTAIHEAFAQNFEKYLYEGKAPSGALRDAFAKFRDWMLRVYSKYSEIDMAIDEDTRAIFDGMLATKQQIASAAVNNSMYNLTEGDMEDAGLTAEIRGHLRRLLDKARFKAEADLLDEQAKNRRKMIQMWRVQAVKAMRQERVYNLRAALREEGGFDGQMLDAVGGEGTYKAVKEKGANFARKEGGKDPNVMAVDMDYNDAQEMILELLDSVSEGERANQILEEQIAAYDATFDPDMYLLSQPEIQQYIADTLRLSKFGTGREATQRNTARVKQFAEQKFRAMTVAEALDVNRILTDLRIAMREQRTGMRQGDVAKIKKNNLRVRVQMELLRQARNFDAEYNAANRKFKRINKTGKGKIHPKYRDNIRLLFTRFGIKTEVLSKEELDVRTPLRELLTPDPDSPAIGVAAAFSDTILDETFESAYDTLTTDQFTELVNLVSYLDGTGRRLVKGYNAYVKQTAEEVIDQAMLTMAGLRDKRAVSETSPVYGLVHTTRRFFAELDFFKTTLQRLDGYKREGGTLVTAVYNPISAGMNDAIGASSRVTKALHKPYQVIHTWMARQGKVVNTGVKVPEIMAREGMKWTPDRVFAVAMNMGTEYNKQAVMAGYGLSEGDLHELTSSLGEKEWNAIQRIWDVMADQWDGVAEVHEQLNFFRPRKVNPTALNVKVGTDAKGNPIMKEIKGGYYPVMFDSSLDQRVAETQEAEDFFKSQQAMFSSPKVNGPVHSRQGTGGRPVLLSSNVIARYLETAIQYTYLAVPITNADMIISNKRFQSEAKKKLGSEAVSVLRPALKDAAQKSSQMFTVIDSWLNRMANKSTAYILALKPSVAWKQVFSSPGALVDDDGAQAVWRGIKSFISNPMATIAQIREMSDYMNNRVAFIERDVLDGANRLNPHVGSRSIFGIPREVQDGVAFGLIKLFDAAVTMPLWKGGFDVAFDQNMARLEAENAKLGLGRDYEDIVAEATKLASQAADERVIASQPSRRTIDLAKIQRNRNGIARLFTMFSTFTIKYGNRMRFSYGAWRNGSISTSRYIGEVMVESLLPPVLMYLTFSMLWGQGLPDDEDDFKSLAADILGYQFSGFPILRDISYAVRSKLVGDVPYRNPWDSPAFTGMELGLKSFNGIVNVLTDTDDEEGLKKAAMTLADFFSFQVGVPASRVYRDILEGVRQYEENEDTTVFNIIAPNPAQRGNK